MRFVWHISAGQLFESIRPVAFALAALASTWVLFDARRPRRHINAYAVVCWTLGTLFFSLIVLPLYLIVRRTRRQHAWQDNETSKQSGPDHTEFVAPPPDGRERPRDLPHEGATTNKMDSRAALFASRDPSAPDDSATHAPPLAFKWTLPTLYALLLLSLGTFFFYQDARSIDAHLARANQARVMNDRVRTIREYEAALRLEDDAHTHNLLGIELAADSHWEEALTQFRAAERGGEPDDELPFHIATTLDDLHRTNEAALEYQKFLNTSRCAQSNHFPQCDTARVRIQVTQTNNKR